MKRIAVFCAVLLLFAGFACGEGAQGFWTRNAEIYYHLNENCSNTQGMVPISREAALAFAKQACPVCVPVEDGGADVRAAARGGVVVVKFSDAWLNAQEFTGVFGWFHDSAYQEAEGWQMLGEYLHGDAYNTFVEAYLLNGSAEGRANMPHILSADGLLVMGRRHIGSDWYVIVRPQEEPRNQWEMYWRVNSLKLQMQGGMLKTSFDLQTREETRKLSLEDPGGGEAVYTRSEGDLEINVYPALDGYIAVLQEANAAAERLENVQLMIGEARSGETLNGYMEGGRATYCCMLTEGELSALRDNAEVQLWHLEQMVSDVYRVDEGKAYLYYSNATGGKLFSVSKLDGMDPADSAFRILMDGEPGRFALYTAGGVEICDYAGKRYSVQTPEGTAAERLTPLFWYGQKGVFLAEYSKYTDFDMESLLFTDGVEYGVRIGSGEEDEWASYLCWLVDENGRMIGGGENRAFVVQPNGEIHMENLEGRITVFAPSED